MQEVKFKNFINEQQVEIALIVATSIELDTALDFLMPYEEDQEIYKIQENENTYYCGLFGVYSTVIVKSNSMGSIGLGASLQTTSTVIEIFKPKAVIMGGIAFGKDPKKQNFGDILISDSIISYDPTRRNKDGNITYRGAKPNTSITLFNRFSQINEYTVFFDGADKKVALFRGPLLSGEILIDNQKFKDELTKKFPDAIGGEMEGAGVYAACQKNNIPWIIIKSICDWGDGEKDKTQQGLAAFTSLSFIHEHLKSELIFESLGIISAKGREQDIPEINIDALDILKLIVSKRDMKKISKNLGTRNRDKKIYYEYYKLDDEKICKGFLFLGNYITNNNIFEDFLQKQKGFLPDKLEIFLAKKRKSTHIVDRKKSIFERADFYGLKKVLDTNIHYIDDFIWENTFSQTKDDNSHIRNDFIDQKLYSVDLKTNKTFYVGESLTYFVEQLNNQSTPISIVLGTGGVGKTTFCDSLQHTINNNTSLKKKVFYIKGEKVVKFFLSSPEQRIESLDDLYDLYKEETDFLDIEKDEFNLNFISGNAIVLIDAIEEIESALNERFNLQSFFDSLKRLYQRFYSTKIILTTREHFLPKIESLEGDFSSAYYMLQGFEKNNLDSFLIKRYKDDLSNRNLVKKFLEDNKLFTEKELVVPLFVDWACQIIDRPETNSKIESKYFCTQYSIDKLIINLLDREITKQSLNIDIDGMFKLLEEIIIQYRGIMPKQDFKEYIEIESNQGIDNFVKNPLFIQDGDFIKIKYDILHNIIKSRYLHYSLINKQISVNQTVLFKEMFLGKGDLFAELVNILHINIEQAIDSLGFFIRGFAKKYFDDCKSIDKENIRKSISGLLYLSIHFVNKKDQTEITEVLKKLYSSDSKIKGLFIYGAFYSINFSNINIIDGLFDNYTNFSKCNFSTREDKIFYFVTFRNMQLPIVKTIKKSFFDSSCNYIESNINEITEQLDSSSNKKIEQVKRDFITITKYIETSQKSENLIKKHCTIQDHRGIKKFLLKLVTIGYLETIENDLYKISKKYYDHIPSIKLGNFIDEIEDFLEELIAI